MADGWCPYKSTVDVLKVTAGDRTVRCGCWWGCMLAQPGEYNWTFRVWRRYGLMSNYFDHLSVLFVCEQRKHRTSSHVYDDYEDIDGAEESKSVYRGNIIVVVLLILLLLLHPFNSLFSRTTWVSRHQKGKPFWILLKQEIMTWQWHQLDHMQISCTLLQTDNHASTAPLSEERKLVDTSMQAEMRMSRWMGGIEVTDRLTCS